MKRREFMHWVGAGILASSLPVAIAACDTSEPAADAPQEPAEPTGTFTAVGAVSELDSAGALTADDVQGSPVVVIRNLANPAAVVALDPRCPHQGCAVDWQGEAGEFLCPCHRSRFGADGSVLAGPASTPLATYPAQIEGDQVLVSVG